MIRTKMARGLRMGGLAGASAVALLAGLAISQPAMAQDSVARFDVPEQPLGQALLALGRQARISVAVPQSLVAGRTAPAVEGELSTEMALNQLLAGSGLRAEFFAPDVVRIVQEGEGGSPQGGSGAGDAAEVEALIVTAQKKEEDIQDVPIAISAFTQKSLDAQKIEGGFDLLKAIPNVTFSKNNFAGYNFSIRGIGTKAVSAATDPGVAVSFNNTTLIVNRLFEQEYFDIQRVEVLRGPQGTLYGRNATSGVINLISERPKLGDFAADLKLEAGNYNARRARGMVNIPVGETLALRIAGAMTQRDGYGFNEASEDPNAAQEVKPDVDNRDLWSLRGTLGWEPIEQIRVNLLWERFQEDDRRARTSKQLCHTDPGPQTIGSFNWDMIPDSTLYQAMTSQGCLPGSLYDDGAFGTPNGASLPYVNALYIGPLFGTLFDPYALGFNRYIFDQFTGGPLEPPCGALVSHGFTTFPLDLCQPDPYRGLTQSTDIRTIYSLIEPKYEAKADVFELSIDLDLTDSLTFTSQTVFNRDTYYASQDFNRFTTAPIFENSSLVCNPETVFSSFQCGAGTAPLSGLLPDGVFTDPQLGPSRTLVGQDLVDAESEQFNQEFRLVSNFGAPLNFSLGANFTRFRTNVDYYVFINSLSLLTNFFPFNVACSDSDACVYVDPNPLQSIDGQGHNYFRSANPYELTSSAIFGEAYWQITDTLKLTAGARMTWDHKVFTPIPSQLLLLDYRKGGSYTPGDGPETCTLPLPEICPIAGNAVDGKGYPADPDIRQEWREPTGRLILDWKPDLPFTDETMVYGSIAHGYKGGGANPPGIAAPSGLINRRNSAAFPPTFDPEFINAFEVGTKNVLMGGGLVLNAAAFYYDYEGYQVSKIVDRSAANENFDATVWGAEMEWVFSPTRNLRFNGTLGYLQTKIADGEQSLDLMDRTQGGNISFTGSRGYQYDEWVVLKSWITFTSNCIAPKEVVEAVALAGVGDNTTAYNARGATIKLCPGGGVDGKGYTGTGLDPFVPGLFNEDGSPRGYDPLLDAPNGGAGFLADLSGNELPNAPHWTMSIGAQYTFALPWGWDATARVDHYWQDESFARVYNTEYDRLRSWQNTNFSLWIENPDWGVKAEAYVKNAFDEEPITDAFLNSDDTGLTTNVFTLDPRLVGVSVTKSF